MRPLIVKKFEIIFNEEFLKPDEISAEDATIDIKFRVNNYNTFEVTNISYLEKDNLIKSFSTILDDKDTKIVFDEFSNIYLETTKELIHFYVSFDKGDGYITTSIKYENNAYIKKAIKNFISKLEKINLMTENDFNSVFDTREFQKEMKVFQKNFEKNITEKQEVVDSLLKLQQKYSIDIFNSTTVLDNVLYNSFAELVSKISLTDDTNTALEIINDFDQKLQNKEIINENQEVNEELQEVVDELPDENKEVDES